MITKARKKCQIIIVKQRSCTLESLSGETDPLNFFLRDRQSEETVESAIQQIS